MRLASLTLAMLAAVSTTRAQEKKKPVTAPQATSKASGLSSEDKEVLKHRELLENLDLLMNFEQVKYIEFFADKKIVKTKEKPETKSPVKDNASKNPK